MKTKVRRAHNITHGDNNFWEKLVEASESIKSM